MSDHKQSQEFVFYQEALRAFDAPIIQEAPQQPEPVPVQPAQQPEVPGELQDVLQEQPVKPSLWQRWWPAVACGVLCIVLLISFWPRQEEVAERGENWIYGTLSFVTEDIVIVTDRQGERWYVELNGLEAPELPQVGYNMCWVFFNGEPKTTDTLNCTKRVTATWLRDSQGVKNSGFPQYGKIYDQISFDLDADGKQESWLLYSGATSGRVSYCLVALDEQGQELHKILFFPVVNDVHVFHISGGKLTMIAPSEDDYISVEIRLTDGHVTLHHGADQLDSTELSVYPTIGSPNQNDTQPHTDLPKACQIQFSLYNIYADDKVSAKTKWLSLTGSDAEVLQNFLNKLSWKYYTDESILQPVGSFTVADPENQREYFFTKEGMLYRAERCAQLSGDDGWYLVTLMRRAGDEFRFADEKLYGADAQGNLITLKLTKSGSFTATSTEWVMSQAGILNPVSQILNGAYAVVGNCLYLTGGGLPYISSGTGGQKFPASLVFILQENGIQYRADLSGQSAFEIPDRMTFKPEEFLGATMQFGLYRSRADAAKTQSFYLSHDDRQTLQQLLDRQVWRPASGTKEGINLGYFTLKTSVNTDAVIDLQTKTYTFTANGYMLYGGKCCKMEPLLWSHILDLLKKHSDPADQVAGGYKGGDRQGNDVLIFLDGMGAFHCYADLQSYSGNYAIAEDLLYLHSGSQMDWSMVLDIVHGGIVYNAEMSENSGLDIADGTVFLQEAWVVIPE